MLTLMHAACGVEDEHERERVRQLFYTYGRRVKALAQSILRNEQDAEDALHDTFLKIIQYREKFFRLDGDETARLIVIYTRSVCFNLYRRRQRERGIFVPDTDDADIARQTDGIDLLERVLAQESAERLRDAIDALPNKEFRYYMVKDLPVELLWEGEKLDAVARAFDYCNVNESRVRDREFRWPGFLFYHPEGMPDSAWFTEEIPDGTEARTQLFVNGSAYPVAVFHKPSTRDELEISAGGAASYEVYYNAEQKGLFNETMPVLFTYEESYLQYASAVYGETFGDMSQLTYDGALILQNSLLFNFRKLRRMFDIYEQNGFIVTPERQVAAGAQRYNCMLIGYPGAVTALYALLLFLRRRRGKRETA